MARRNHKRLDALQVSLDYVTAELSRPDAPTFVLDVARKDLNDALLAFKSAFSDRINEPNIAALCDRSESLLSALLARIRAAEATEKAARQAQRAAEILRSVAIRRCRVCDGGSFQVQSSVALEASATLPRWMVMVCTSCGDVRMTMPLERVASLDSDDGWVRVELPGGSGPFRG